jgi:hypothetical protein
MENKNNGNTTTSSSTPPAPQGVDIPFNTVRTRVPPAGNSAPPPGSADADDLEIERLARRYSREAQLAMEGLLYLSLRWPFELMAALVSAGRKWEEEYYRPTAKRRVSLYDEEKK